MLHKRLTRAGPSPDLTWRLADPVRVAVRPGQPLAPPMQLYEDGFEHLGWCTVSAGPASYFDLKKGSS